MHKSILMAAFAASIPTSALADDWVLPDQRPIEEDCRNCAQRTPAPPAPEPEPTTPVVEPAPEPAPELPAVEPTPVAVVRNITVNAPVAAPPVPVPEKGNELFHIGFLAGGNVGQVPVQAGLLSPDPMVSWGGEVQLGLWTMYAEDAQGTPYFGARATVGMGSLTSRSYGGGLDAGLMVADQVGLGTQLNIGGRDLLVEDNTWAARYIGGDLGLGPMFRLDVPQRGSQAEMRILVMPFVGYGGFARDPDRFWSGGLHTELRIGLGDRRRSK